MTLCNGEVGIL